MKLLLITLLLLITACSPPGAFELQRKRKILEMRLTKECIKEAATLGPQNNAHKVIEECSKNASYDSMTLIMTEQ